MGWEETVRCWGEGDVRPGAGITGAVTRPQAGGGSCCFLRLPPDLLLGAGMVLPITDDPQMSDLRTRTVPLNFISHPFFFSFHILLI